MNKKELFAKRLFDLMSEKGINQSKLARETGITNQAISLWLNEKREPLLTNLWILAEYFNCSVDFLIGKTDY